MKKINSMFIMILAVIMIVSTTATTAFAATNHRIELKTRSVLLVDRSGSMKDREKADSILDRLDPEEFDFIGYFDDNQISVDPSYKGGGDSHICKTIDEIAKAGFTHITIITDGEQWPKGGYDDLSVYTDLDITIHLTEESKASDEFISQLESRLTNSSLTVATEEGREVILNDYKAPVYTVEIPEESDSSGKDENSSFMEKVTSGKCYWWIALIAGAIIAALFDFIHELITRGRNKEEEPSVEEENNDNNVVIPQEAAKHLSRNTRVLADSSGSMAGMQRATYKACKNAQGMKKVLIFGNDVSLEKVRALANLTPSGKTAGWEALEEASRLGDKNLFIVSDLGFNQKGFDPTAFQNKFKKIILVVPGNYNNDVFDDICLIAEEIEVIPLQ